MLDSDLKSGHMFNAESEDEVKILAVRPRSRPEVRDPGWGRAQCYQAEAKAEAKISASKPKLWSWGQGEIKSLASKPSKAKVLAVRPSRDRNFGLEARLTSDLNIPDV